MDNPLLILRDSLVRDATLQTIKTNLNHLLATTRSINITQVTQNVLEDVFVLVFHTRAIHEGKGLRNTSLLFWNVLLHEPMTQAHAINLLDLVPVYGSWNDLFKMPVIAHARVLDIVVNQIYADEVSMCDGTSKISLLAKWMPREGDPMAFQCAAKLFPGSMPYGTRMKLYRKRLAILNRLLDTVETKMCSGQWDAIVPTAALDMAFLRHEGSRANFIEHVSNRSISRPFHEQPIRDRVRAVARETT